MPNRNWRERVRHELQRQGLPPAYVARLVEELSDHATDLFKEDSSMDTEQILDARLGSPTELASLASSQFQHRSFAGRHPWLTFVAAPVAVVAASLVATFLLLAAVGWLGDLVSGGALSANDESHLPPSELEMRVVHLANTIVRFVPFFVSAFFFARLGQRSGRQVWSVCACGIIALIAVSFLSVVSPRTADGPGMWTLGVGWPFRIDQLLQALVPLGWGAWVFFQISTSRMRAVPA